MTAMQPLRPRSSTPTQRSGIDDLITEIDAYLATQLAREPLPRPTSAGTMFVDLDAAGTMQISYRNQPARSRSPPLLVAQDLHVRYDRGAAAEGLCGMYVEGYDAATRFAYDYDGSIMHLHREGSRASECHSDYWAVDAEQYNPRVPLVIKDDEEQYMLARERRKRGRAVGFIQGVLSRVEGLGMMKRFREEKRKASRRNRGRGLQRGCGPRDVLPQVPKAWVDGGCVS